jgi:8-oxo-dGTP diphosphatase
VSVRIGQEIQALPRAAGLIARPAPIHVVAGVLRDRYGRVLVAQRPDGKHLAGLWEFPGGKCEPGESAIDALRRELHEEIGVDVESAQPLIAVPHDYPEKRIVLDVWNVEAYSGVPHARETQALRWIAIDALVHLPMPRADVPVVAALRLPDRYLITPAFDPSQRTALLEGIGRACAAGIRMIQLRQPHWPHDALAETARHALDICRSHGARLLLNADWRAATALGLDGAHLPAVIARQLDARPFSPERWLAVSCHDAAELEHAQRIGADFVTLSPVAPTPSHPAGTPLGWPRFAALARDAAVPVYALGGLGVADIADARAGGGQGIAAIRALWS